VIPGGENLSGTKKPSTRGDGSRNQPALSTSGRFQDLIRLDARCADGEAFGPAIDICPDALKIWKPAATGPVVCVADVVAAHRFLSADVTHFCHENPLPGKIDWNKYRENPVTLQPEFFRAGHFRVRFIS
jgi:hypothetical protein